MFITTATAMYSFGHGLRTLPVVPRLTQPSTVRGMAILGYKFLYTPWVRSCHRRKILYVFYVGHIRYSDLTSLLTPSLILLVMLVTWANH